MRISFAVLVNVREGLQTVVLTFEQVVVPLLEDLQFGERIVGQRVPPAIASRAEGSNVKASSPAANSSGSGM